MTKRQHGFVEVKQEELTDIMATAHYYQHEQSGGQVVWIETADENQAFGIGFKTPPEDSAGVAHILEHTVLAGSEKFPVKDPFMTMMTSSMATFLNAMTFSDMTLFPFSSTNQTDFANLMVVYLDAVFAPKVMTDERLFRQEGWHYELADSDAPLTVNGIVYNEMRGEYTNPDRLIRRQVDQYTHPGSTYAHESGGDPQVIPTLTYEEFKAYYKKWYRPDNALVGLYGTVDIAHSLAQIDEYYSRFEASNATVERQVPTWEVGRRQLTVDFPADETLKVTEDSYLSYAVPATQLDDLMGAMRVAILMLILVDSETSLLREKIVDAGLADDMYTLSADGQYADMRFVLENINAERADEIVQIIEDTLKEMAEQGLDRELLEATVDQNELSARQLSGRNRGITVMTQLMGGWRYRNQPTDVYQFQAHFKQLREDIQNGVFDELLQQFISSPDCLILVHRPSNEKRQQQQAKEAERLEAIKQSFSADEREQVMADEKALKDFQETPDSPENLQTLPFLTLDDIESKVTTFDETRESLAGDGVLLSHCQPANGVDYVTLAFALSDIPFEDIPYINDLAFLLGELNTTSHTYKALEVQAMRTTGGISIDPGLYLKRAFSDDFAPRFLIKTKALTKNLRYGLDIIKEILTETDWTDVSRMRRVVSQVKNDVYNDLSSAGSQTALTRLNSRLTASGRYAEQMDGVAYYDHLVDLLEALEREPDTVVQKLKDVLARIVNRESLVVSVTADDYTIEETQTIVKDWLETLPLNERREVLVIPAVSADIQAEALTQSDGVQYIAYGSRLSTEQFQPSGKWTVFTNLMSNDILYRSLRLQGGAYGQGLVISQTGVLAAYSYRDPKLDQTIDVFQQMANVLKNTPLTQEAINRLIIGVLGQYQYPLPPQLVNAQALKRYFINDTEETVMARMQEALHTEVADVDAFIQMLETMHNDPKVVVFGNEDTVEAAKQHFDQVRALKRD